MTNKSQTIAIIGASKNPDKYGNIVLKDLSSKGHKIIPINPKEKTIENLTTYKNLQQAIQKNENQKQELDIVVFITPPNITLEILKQIKQQNILNQIPKIWFQPGSSSKEVIDFCKQNNLDFENNECIMLVLN